MAGDGDLVVRQELLGLLLGSAPGVMWDVRGIAGAGKSVLLREVERRAARDDVVVLLEMQDYFTAFGQGETAADAPGEAGEELRRFGRALSAVMSGLRDLSAAAQGVVRGDPERHRADGTGCRGAGRGGGAWAGGRADRADPGRTQPADRDAGGGGRQGIRAGRCVRGGHRLSPQGVVPAAASQPGRRGGGRRPADQRPRRARPARPARPASCAGPGSRRADGGGSQ